MTPKQILKAARAKIKNPDAWGKGPRGGPLTGLRPLNTCCLAEAVEGVRADWADTKKAFVALKNAIGLDSKTAALVEWNDEPERTHDEVIRALALAIRLA